MKFAANRHYERLVLDRVNRYIFDAVRIRVRAIEQYDKQYLGPRWSSVIQREYFDDGPVFAPYAHEPSAKSYFVYEPKAPCDIFYHLRDTGNNAIILFTVVRGPYNLCKRP